MDNTKYVDVPETPSPDEVEKTIIQVKSSLKNKTIDSIYFTPCTF